MAPASDISHRGTARANWSRFETRETCFRFHHMTKGQQAIAVAMVYPETGVGGKGKKAAGTKAAESAGFSYRRLAEARTVLEHAPDLAVNVLAGSSSLDDAYKTAREVKRGAGARRSWRST